MNADLKFLDCYQGSSKGDWFSKARVQCPRNGMIASGLSQSFIRFVSLFSALRPYSGYMYWLEIYPCLFIDSGTNTDSIWFMKTMKMLKCLGLPEGIVN
jgi:hypothetical protein